MAEGAPLLREYGSKAHRGFESLPLRQSKKTGARPVLLLRTVAQQPRLPDITERGGQGLALVYGIHGRVQPPAAGVNPAVRYEHPRVKGVTVSRCIQGCVGKERFVHPGCRIPAITCRWSWNLDWVEVAIGPR